MRLQGLHGQVVDGIGRALAARQIPEGGILRLEDLQERYGVSRTVAREAVRVLESMRVVTSRPRVGVTVLPLSAWNLYDPQVIRWRLASPYRAEQLRELSELRTAVEVSAAALAAANADEQAKQALRRHAADMGAAATAGDRKGYVAADAAFHRVLLSASGNGMFAQFSEVTQELLESREELALLPQRLSHAAADQHRFVADAIDAADAAGASAGVRALLAIADHEVESLL
ncbi:FadR/GntR family transcriptional regulator [Nonomuraea sp. NPDC050536]|uniref:FadR/GntR family transcriptional regulator n=1 Tax=Nonomuraea sp. NPDC050536 TaxID=3364366 RepID=UPI0037C6DF03